MIAVFDLSRVVTVMSEAMDRRLRTAGPPPSWTMPGSEGGAGAGEDVRLAPAKTALATRLGGVCQSWDAAEFDALIERIARMKLRWADLGYSD